MFETEWEMSRSFEKYLKMTFGNSYLKEQSGLFGIPDFVFCIPEQEKYAFISFELKLTNWKRAAKQAFRYKSFSHASYVVMDNKKGKAAIGNLDFFKRYNIGLATFEDEGLFKIYYKPQLEEPFSTQLNSKLIKSIGRSRKKTQNTEILWA